MLAAKASPVGKVRQSINGAKAEAWGLVTSGGSLNVLSDRGLTISADAQEGSSAVTAKAVVSANSVNVYQVQNDLKSLQQQLVIETEQKQVMGILNIHIRAPVQPLKLRLLGWN